MFGITGAVTGLFWLAVSLGALVMFLRNPAKGNTLIAAGPETITGLIHGLESGKIN